MTLWLILGALGAAVAAVLFLSLRRGGAAPDPAAAHDLAVYRAQLEELERDRERGVLEDAEFESARLEVQRRLLAADAAQAQAGGTAMHKAGWQLPLALALAVPLGAGGVYLWLGNPGVDSQPFAARQGGGTGSGEMAGGAEAMPDVDTMMARLRERLAAAPDDLEGWLMLGRSAMALGDYGEAADAYRRATALDGAPADTFSALGEAEVMVAGGIVSEPARRALEEAAARDPSDPRARFYLAVARDQDGDKEGALAELNALIADTPIDAPWAEGVRQRAVLVAQSLGLDPVEAVPGLAAAPATADPAARAEELAAQLEQDPKNYEGWIELARLRAEQGDAAGAQAALDRGREVYAGAPFVLQQIESAEAALGLADGEGEDETAARGPTAEDMAAAAEMSADEQQEMIKGMVAGLATRLEEEPDDVEGWLMLGRSYQVLEEPAKSAEAYGRAAALRPDDPQVQLDYATALLTAAGDGDPPPEAVERLEQVLASQPGNPNALYYLGEVAQRQGETAAAADYWTRLLTLLPEGSEDHTWLKGRLEALDTSN